MASGAVAGDGFFRGGGFEGCISHGDVEITRRPYHRNCSCALHKMHGKCSHVSLVTTVSFPSRRARSEGSLGLVVSASRGSSSSPYSSPAVGPTNRHLPCWELDRIILWRNGKACKGMWMVSHSRQRKERAPGLEGFENPSSYPLGGTRWGRTTKLSNPLRKAPARLLHDLMGRAQTRTLTIFENARMVVYLPEKFIMATGAGGDGMFHRVYGGCISTDEVVVRRRPYHSNCTCALHEFSHGGHCSPRAKVSYPIRRSWSEGSMVAMTSTAVSCPSSTTVAASLTVKDSSLPTYVSNDH
ncbi:hypothetical protein OSB04_015218 [Centaurea solstitialis]|uniref:Uncharacterized protein n=1 Tax=Centaurea solstitialis TaxID=347529 RepID=A0AA38SYR8_9ASTR|nr:hypothetical protein OSB04_015218 [Centaurea solstitialis]